VPDYLKKYLLPLILFSTTTGGYFAYTHFFFIDTDDGNIEAQILPITTKISGVLEKVFVTEDQEITQGDPIAQLDQGNYIREMEAAQEAETNAEKALHEAETAYSEGASTSGKRAAKTQQLFQVLQNNNQTYKEAQAQLAQANKNLENTKIIAPQDGLIRRKRGIMGSFLTAGDEIVGFIPANNYWAIGHFADTDLSRVEAGATASIKIDGMGWATLHGVVEVVHRRSSPSYAKFPPAANGPDVSKTTPRTYVKIHLIDLSKADKLRLRDGLPATVSVTTR
jgi:membrane fusion protein (multidrug efflux system)